MTLFQKSGALLRRWILGAGLFMILVAGPAFAETAAEACSPEKSIRVELNLSKKWKKKGKEIRKAFKEQDGRFTARVDFFPFIDPPMNIGIGRCVSAEQARFAIRESLNYNRGINQLIFQKVLPHHWIGIGYTKLPERTWIAISGDDLEKLSDPSLSTEAFQALYRRLSQITEQPGIFGMPPTPVEPDPEKP